MNQINYITICYYKCHKKVRWRLRLQDLESDCLGENPARPLRASSQYEILNVSVPQFPYL